MKKNNTMPNKTEQVDEFMEKLEYPLKKEVQLMHDAIKSANKNITEEIKWKTPSFSYNGEYLVTFNLRDNQRIHLVFHTQ